MKQSSTNLLLFRAGTIGGLVHHQRRRAAPVEETDCRSCAIFVGGFERTGEILRQIDRRPVECSVGAENTGNCVVVGLGVVADDGGVDEKGQKGELVCSIIVLQQRGCIVVAVSSIRI